MNKIRLQAAINKLLESLYFFLSNFIHSSPTTRAIIRRYQIYPKKKERNCPAGLKGTLINMWSINVQMLDKIKLITDFLTMNVSPNPKTKIKQIRNVKLQMCQKQTFKASCTLRRTPVVHARKIISPTSLPRTDTN